MRELIDKAEVYNAIAALASKYLKLTAEENDRSKWFLYNEMLKDIVTLKFMVYDMETPHQNYKCVSCGKPVEHDYSLCNSCIEKAVVEKEEYIKYVKEQQKNETRS